MTDQYDTLIIGAGQAGIPLAKALAKAGRTVALAERKHLGGSCVNFGCTPTKAAIASARVAHVARRAAEYGVTIPSVEVDFPKVLERANTIAESSRNWLQQSFGSSDNPRLLHGHVRFVGKTDAGLFRLTIDAIDAHEILAREVIVDTGTRSMLPLIDGIDQIDFIDSENWLEHTRLPAHLAIVGGGYIGLEMAQFYRRMGSEVTVIEHSNQVAQHEDGEVADALQQVLASEGIRFRMNAKVNRFENMSHAIAVTIDSDGKPERLEATNIFVAVGRKPNTDGLGLDTVGVVMDDKGFVPVDKHLSTNVPGIWAVGDIRGGPMFTHTAWDDYRIVESQLTGDGSHTMERMVPYAIFTDPELGRVGMTEQEARKNQRHVRIGRYDMKHNGKARELGETQGFVKVVIDGDTGQLLGAAVFATEAAELVHLYVELMNANAPYTVIERAVHIHPTLAEALQSAVLALR